MPFTVNDEALAKLDALDDAGKRAVLSRMSGEQRAQVLGALPAWRSKQKEPEPSKPRGPQVSGLEALASGLAQAPAGLGDELGAGMQAQDTAWTKVPEVLSGKKSVRDALKDVVQTYRQARFENRQTDEAARQQHPGTYYSGLAAGVLGTAPLAAGGKAAQGGATLLPRVVSAGRTGLGQGAAFGSGASEADLTRGEAADFANDVAAYGATGGLLSGGLALASGGVGAAINRLRQRASKGLEGAVAAERGVQERLTQKNINSALGSYRSAVQSASRDLEVLEQTAQGSDEVAARARAFLASPEADKLRTQVATAKLGTAPERIAEMNAAQQEFAQLAANREANIAAQTEEALSSPVRKHIAPRVLTLGHRVLPVLVGGVGGLVGGTEGALAGSAVGTLMSLSQGAPGRILKNLLEKPAVRQAFWRKVLTAAGGATPSRVSMISALEEAANRGTPALQQAVNAMRNTREGDELLRAVAQAETEPDRAKTLRKALEKR